MKGSFSQIFVGQGNNIDSQVSLVSVLQRLGVKVNQAGTKYNALCPLHHDQNSPSLVIYPDTNTWTCFGATCINPHNPGKQNGGGVIEFVKQYKRMSYNEAVQWIRSNFNLSIKRPKQLFKPPPQLPKILDENIAYYHSLLDLNEQRDWFRQRGLTDKTIDEQALGFDGESHVIPIWKNAPRISDCLCIKLRRHSDNGPKYVRLGSYQPCLYNAHICKNSNVVYLFAGELDALLAAQDGLPACSVVNGVKSVFELPNDWPNLYFPKAQKLVVIFDKQEEQAAAMTMKEWDKYKGKFTSQLFMWHNFVGKDYTDYRLTHTFSQFKQLL